MCKQFNKSNKSLNGKKIIIDYFDRIEKSLVSLSESAQMPKGDETDTGNNREHLVSDFLSKHLPELASVVTSGIIIDAETELERSQQVDVIVLNRFSFASRFFPSGHFPAESVYLALEVKSNKNKLEQALRQCANIKRLKKNIRPETAYFGYTSEPGKKPDLKMRIGSPSAGIWIWPEENENYDSQWLHEKIKNFLNEENDSNPTQLLPSCVYVPKNLLAFKTYPKIKGKETAQYQSEYWFCNNKIENEHESNGEYPLRYVVYEPNSTVKPPSRLQIFTFWLSQELLKFVHEVPDFFKYAFDNSSLKGRQGYSWNPDAFNVMKYDCGEWKKY